MIKIKTKKDCCGCEACGQICPQDCITYKADSEGFLYPVVDVAECTDCGACERVCPVLSSANARNPEKCLAALNKNSAIRLKSSSGGVFSALAQHVIDEGGVVVGAKFDNLWEVVHDIASDEQTLGSLRSSKYVQSRIRNIFKTIRDLLQARKTVLFSGTPCQILGLRNFLHKDYNNLLTVEIACHGVPSPLVWESYISHFQRRVPLAQVNFRDKSRGWENYRVSIKGANNKLLYAKRSTHDPYMSCFLRHLSIRPSCFNCPSKEGRSGADILIGDLWGCETLLPEFNDHKGASLVLLYSKKGENLIASCNLNCRDINYEEAISFNSAIVRSVNESNQRNDFWKDFRASSTPYNIIKKYGKPLVPTLVNRFKTFIYKIIHG